MTLRRRLWVLCRTVVLLPAACLPTAGGVWWAASGLPAWARAGAATAALIAAAGLVFILLPLRDHGRFFTLAQRDLAAEAYGANCVWRRTHLPPAVAAYLAGSHAVEQPRPSGWWTATLALTLVAGLGLPMTRIGRCRGIIQGGHVWAAADGGTTRIWNCEPCCAAHNRRQSDTWSWWWAARQFPYVWTLPVYGWRRVSGLVRLALLWQRDIDRAKAEPAPAEPGRLAWETDDPDRHNEFAA